MKFLSKWVTLALCVGIYAPSKAQSSSFTKPFHLNSKKPLQISGVYPSLAVFNEGHTKAIKEKNANGYATNMEGNECGIGAIVPWENKLWMITYSPHSPNGSADKLYSIDNNLNQVIHPESVGGTPAGRMIHKESKQLIIGPYFIDSNSHIRVIPPSIMPGRLTAIARHLTNPANMVYFYDMEGALYEANVHTLAVNKLFQKPVPGWHGKGAYTAQHQLVVANNGEDAVFKVPEGMLQVGNSKPQTPEEKGVLASWDGTTWKIIKRRQFTDVTGPGGIYGSSNDKSPLWSIGWDKRSVILELLDDGNWHTYRLPKAAHTYDHFGGWYTEWPRIREVGNSKILMDMHGMFYDFPKKFSYKNSGGLSPIGTHLRYIPDFTNWNGQLVLSTDETTILQNPMAGRSQSNLWFGQWDDLKQWGATSGWGGLWMNDSVKAGQPSDAFLFSGLSRKMIHLSHDADQPVKFTLEIDKSGNNQWQVYKTITVPAQGYQYFIFPEGFSADWIRVEADKKCRATAFFHFTGKALHAKQDAMFSSLASIDDAGDVQETLIRPASHNKNLQVLNVTDGKKQYAEVNENIEYLSGVADSTAQMERLLGLTKHFETDDASVIVHDKTGTFRLPKTFSNYDAFTNYRDAREVESERYMLNAQGTFYEVGRESGFIAIRPITTHKKKIVDFCTWRGLLVMSGTKANAKSDGHYFPMQNQNGGLWFGAIDDLWKLGKPVGEGGVWKNTEVKANTPSLPYLMTGYDKKRITLTANKDVTITLEVDVDLMGWHQYKKIKVPAGKTIHYTFPDGYSAHWIRAVADKDCKATVWLKYD
ncbi:hypothetical protein [Sediminibacterium soli]|uniref:hypothetical protein n=1 Tax=Sediminibacterium soli TaxID=2698829 RepID=UPI0013795B92|nr:hypothetical protein [Sediminibacterium soli]NCI46578.1 hypothetical protein [Sediminibacterium soli]